MNTIAFDVDGTLCDVERPIDYDDPEFDRRLRAHLGLAWGRHKTDVHDPPDQRGEQTKLQPGCNTDRPLERSYNGDP
jgi:FMN phosphatase YigB (HAD superfamily)